MLHLKKVFLILFFTVATVSFADAQNLIVNNNSCGALDIDIVLSTTLCGPATSNAFITAPPGSSTHFMGSKILFLHPSETANLSNYTPHPIYDPSCGPPSAPFPQPFMCNGAMYHAQMILAGPDYILEIF